MSCYCHRTDEHAMNKIYLINETVLFEPERRRLGPASGYPQWAVTLHGPVSECLNLLLERNGEVLSQRFLFTAVWEKQGAVVTTNALYQTIASIRKALKTAGLQENIVQTVPKEGFKSVARIREVSPEEMMTSPTAAALTPPATQEESKRVKKRIDGTLTVKIAYCLAALLFIGACFVLYSELKRPAPIYAHYHSAGKINGCEILSSLRDNNKSRHLFNALSKRYPLTCAPGGVVYITFNQLQLGTVVLVCDRRIENSQVNCHSIFYSERFQDDE